PCLALLQLSCNTQPISQVTVSVPNIKNTLFLKDLKPITNSNLQLQNYNARRPDESVKQWESRLQKRHKYLSPTTDRDQPKNLAECKALYDELLQMDEEAYILQKPLTEEEKLTELEEIVTQQTTPLDNIELQSVQELPIHKERFLDLDVEYAKDMFKVDGAEYVFSTWFTEATDIDLASVILEAENEDETMQKMHIEYQIKRVKTG
ncbi:3875_t:CDS:2, partial [Cetraspora pellucida]